MATPLFIGSEEIYFLAYEHVEFIHEKALLTGGRQGILRRENIDSAISRPKHVYDYDVSADLVRLAAYTWHALASCHGFIDGNKRTAFLCAITFLEANGVELHETVDPVETGKWIEALFRESRFEIDILDHWLRTRCVWIVE